MINPSIPLSVRSPDVVNALSRGTQLAGSANQLRQQNRLQGIYDQHGAGIAQGNQGAINALAGADPMQALQVQQTHQQMRVTDEQLKIARQNAATAARNAATAADRDRLAQEAAEAERLVSMALVAPEMADQLFASNPNTQDFVGLPPEVAAASLLGVKDALAMSQEPEDKTPAAMRTLQLRAEAAGLKPGTPEYQQFMAVGGKAEDGFALEVTPEGGVSVRQGGTAETKAPPKMTVDAAKNSGFYLRTIEANEVLNELEQQGTDFWQQAAENVPLGIGNYMRTPEFQKFDQARRNFVNAILRRESGAVISDQEFDNANKQYFPVPGDSPEVIAQKRANREAAIEGLKVGSGGGAEYIDEQRTEAISENGPWPIDNDSPPEGMAPEIWEWIDPENRKFFK